MDRAWFQRLKLTYDERLSTVPFEFNVRCYNQDAEDNSRKIPYSLPEFMYQHLSTKHKAGRCGFAA